MAGLVIRSVLALLFTVAVAALLLQHAGLPPHQTLASVGNGPGPTGPVLKVGAPTATPPATVAATASASPVGPTARPTPAPTATSVAIAPSFAVDVWPNVQGHIFFTGVDHNLYFVTGRYGRRAVTGDGVDVAPSLSPDGHHLAFVQIWRNYSDLWVAGLGYGRDGAVLVAQAQRITQDQIPPPALQSETPDYPGDPLYSWWATKPSWTPDGNALLYASDRPGYHSSNPEDATLSVWEQGLTATMTDAVRLTTPASGTGGHDSPQWRPHDSSLFLYDNYFSNIVLLPGGQGVIEVAQAPTPTVPMVNPTGPGLATAVQGLTPHGATEYHPVWSPDGRYIAFAEDRKHQRTDLLLMPFHRPGRPLDYYHATVVAQGTPYITQPFWSPDGHWIGYLTGGSGDFTMVVRRADLSGAHPRFGPPITLTQVGALDSGYRPTWGP